MPVQAAKAAKPGAKSEESPTESAKDEAKVKELPQIKLLSYDDEVKPAKSARQQTESAQKKTKPEEKRAETEEEQVSSDEESSSEESQSESDAEQDSNEEQSNGQTGSAKNDKVARPLVERKSAHDRLIKRLRNGVHRQAKLAKKFEIRRLIRMLDKARRSKSQTPRVGRLEERMNAVKALDVSEIEELAIVLGQLSEEDNDEAESEQEHGDQDGEESNAENGASEAEDEKKSEEDAEEHADDDDNKAEASGDGEDDKQSNASNQEPKNMDEESMIMTSQTFKSRFTPEEAKERFEKDVDMKNILQFKGLQLAVREFLDRPKREMRRKLREKQKRAAEALAEQKRLERLKNPLVCMIKMCTARFATEDAREKHRIKRHRTTGDWEKDIALGLRKNRPSSRERQAFQLLKKGGPIEEIDRLMRPLTFSERQAKKRERENDDSSDDGSGSEKESRTPSGTGPKRPSQRDNHCNREARKAPNDRDTQHPKSNQRHADNRKDDRDSKRPRVDNQHAGDKKVDKWTRPQQSGGNKGKEETKLHPSWEAKKKLQEQAKAIEFQGTKVEFSDDDD